MFIPPMPVIYFQYF